MVILKQFSVTALKGLAGSVVGLGWPRAAVQCDTPAWGGHPAGPAVANITAQHLGLALCSDQAYLIHLNMGIDLISVPN